MLDLELVEKIPPGRWLVRPGESGPAAVVLARHGQVPIPPYIRQGQASPEDAERYQTLHARRDGAVAAPTAGLHFSPAVFSGLEARGIERAFVTLHVGPGTFQPVKVADVTQHRVEPEWGELPAETAGAIATCRARGGRVVAIGTTTVRVLETALANGEWEMGNGGRNVGRGDWALPGPSLRSDPATQTSSIPDSPFRSPHSGMPHSPGAWQGYTNLTICPPFRFRVVDALVTNFHLPRSSLLLLVSAFAGMEVVRAAYCEAVRCRYRFYSYGDAMLIL
jgi:S-adenosylmethionine:tRNA ribosyltransferase-isomerase